MASFLYLINHVGVYQGAEAEGTSHVHLQIYDFFFYVLQSMTLESKPAFDEHLDILECFCTKAEYRDTG